MKAFKISVAWLIAGGIFYLAFFVLAPAITRAIPASDWKGLLDLLVYIIVAWTGGVGIPLAIVIAGTVIPLLRE